MFDTFKKYSIAINRIVLFIAAIAVVIYIFPRQGKFQYEYIKGKPWAHNTLIAPFDFPIYKTQAELKTERENTLSSFNPYFNFQNDVDQEYIALFEKDYNASRARLYSKYSFLSAPLPGNPEYDIFSGLRSHTKKLLADIYNKGIISLPEEYQDKPATLVLTVVKDNFAERNELGQYHNYPSAYQYLAKALSAYISNRSEIGRAHV